MTTEQQQPAADDRWTVRKIRDALEKLNNPGVSVEDRQRALTSLLIELCDRIGEGFVLTVRRCGEMIQAAMSQPPQQEEAPAAVPAPPSTATADPAMQAAAELAALPAEMRGPVSQVTPGAPVMPVAVAPPPPQDAAAVAAQLNGADKVPQAPLAK